MCWSSIKGLVGTHRHIVAKDVPMRQYLITASDINKSRPHVGTTGGFRYFDGNIDVKLNTWYHVAFTYDGMPLSLYVDGKLDPEQKYGEKMISSTMKPIIGARSDLVGWTMGTVDEVAIFNKALSVDDINTIMEHGLERTFAVSLRFTIDDL